MKSNQQSFKVYIGNLPYSIKNDDLFPILRTFNGFLSFDLKRHLASNRCKGWGIASFSDESSAYNAIDVLDFKEIFGRKIHAKPDRSQIEQHSQKFNVFVNNIPWHSTQGDLDALFTKFNPLNSFILTNQTGRSKGKALVQFESYSSALNAIQEINGCIFEGRVIECKLDDRSLTQGNALKFSLFVGKFPKSIDESILESTFSHYGPIYSVKITKGANGKSKGWGIVTFCSSEDAHKAIELTNGKVLLNGNKYVNVKFDKKPDIRQSY